MTENRWLQLVEQNAGHSAWYIERFRAMAEAGDDLDGEARLIDAIAPRRARVLDAGCGTGRVGGRLAALGHRVVGVDLHPVLIDAARRDHPAVTWLVGDLAELDLTQLDLAGVDGDGDGHGDGDDLTGAEGEGDAAVFDVIVSAGDVMTFLDPSTRVQVLMRIATHLAPRGRAAIGFGAGRGYDFDEFFADVTAAGLSVSQRLATWDLHPHGADSAFLVALLMR